MTDWKRRLRKKTVLLADGAWGTELVRRGLEAGSTPETWNLDRPADVAGVASAYVMAGSDIILSNTFGGSEPKLAKVGLADRVVEINRRGAEISKQVAADRALVFASIGPTGELLEPLGTASCDDMIAWFTEQAKALVEGGADGIVIETMSDLNEAQSAIHAVRAVSSLPVVVSMTFSLGKRGFATMMGVRPEEAAEALAEAGADIVGANCGSSFEEAVEIARLMRSATTKPLWIKPNAGVPSLVDGKTVFEQSPEDMAAHLEALVGAGANIVGGCCGSTPDHIRLLAKRLPGIIDALSVVSDPLADLEF